MAQEFADVQAYWRLLINTAHDVELRASEAVLVLAFEVNDICEVVPPDS